MSLSAPDDSSALVFTACFVIIWAGALVITLNAKLLGGSMYVAKQYTV
jgi:protein YIPF6